MIKLALLVSGGGTTMEKILFACYYGTLKGWVSPELVIASKDSIKSIERALQAGMPESQIIICGRKHYESEEMFGQALVETLQGHGITHVGQYGWLCKTPKNVIDTYQHWIVNQHPGALDTGYPDFGGDGMYGRRVHYVAIKFAQAVAHEKGWPQYTEATTHRVTEEYDKGAVIGRKEVEILPDDTVETLQQRVLPVEHQLQIEVLERMATGRVEVFRREKRLIDPWRVILLNRLKEEAFEAYPNG